MKPSPRHLINRKDPVNQSQTTKTSQLSPLAKPVLLCILDGWGHRDQPQDNALAMADLPNWRRFLARYPHSLLATSGTAVGLPDGQMGNSEVGHMNIGSGRVVYQDLPRIDKAIHDGVLAKDPVLLGQLAKIKQAGGCLHLLGLLSPGGVHSHQDHLEAIAKIAADQSVPVKVHAFLDGRDTPPSSAQGFLTRFEDGIAGRDIVVATVSGRFWTMDRDNRWDRVEKGYRAMVAAQGERAATVAQAVQNSYDKGETDEFVLPTIIGDYAGMKDGDGVLMANFRADRAREILQALIKPDFASFERGLQIRFSAALGLTEYSTALSQFLTTLFPAQTLTHLLGEVLAEAGKTQLRIAETEKYAHVTFFFNGGREQVYPGEDRILVPSPKVATYDLAPSMSALDVTDKLEEAIASNRYDVIVVNYANGDMVGHTGIMAAAIEAAETVDRCLGRLEAAIVKAGGIMLITADHGNLELMRDAETGEPHTAHTTGPVDAVLVNAPTWVTGMADGKLADVAPTLLSLLGVRQPPEMTGTALISQRSDLRAAG